MYCIYGSDCVEEKPPTVGSSVWMEDNIRGASRRRMTWSFILRLRPSHTISGGAKNMAQLLVGRNFKTAQQNSTKLETTISQHVFNHIVNFQSKWTTNVEMTVAWKLCVQKSDILHTRNIECAQRALCVAYCCDIVVTSLSMLPNFHHYHCKYIWNWFISHTTSVVWLLL